MFFKHKLPQNIGAVKSTERFLMLLTKIESSGIGLIIPSSLKMLQEEGIIAKNMHNN